MIPVSHPMKSAGKSRVVRLVKYVTDDQGNPDRVGDIFISNCGGADAYFASKEMLATQKLNTTSQADKTYHLTISFPSGEKPDAERLKEIEERIASALGYAEHQRIAVVHNDTDNVHIHMVINKIHPTKNTIRTVYNDHGKLAKICGQLEKEYGLSFDNHEAKKSHEEGKIDSIERKSGVEAFAAYAREHAEAALGAAKTWEEFHQQLADKRIAASLRGNGLVFTDHTGEHAAKGSSLGRNFSKVNLEKVLGAFEASGENFLIRKFSDTYKGQPKNREKVLFAEYKAEKDASYKKRQETAKDRGATAAEDNALYAEYSEIRNKTTAERKEKLEALNAGRGAALEAARERGAGNAKGGVITELFQRDHMKRYFERREIDKAVREAKADFEAKREEIREYGRQTYAEWLKEKADAGDGRAAQALGRREEQEQRKKARESGAEPEREKPQTFDDWLKGRADAGDERAAEAFANREAARKEKDGQPQTQTPEPGLYDMYRAYRDREGNIRKELLRKLKDEQEKAIEDAKHKARKSVEDKFMAMFRDRRKTQGIVWEEQRKATKAIYESYKEKRNAVFETKAQGFVEWLKERAEAGDARAIRSLRNKGEAAPELLSISAYKLQDAKTVAAEIVKVTGKGTLYYQVGKDVYKDNGKDISLRDGVDDNGIKNALLLASAKFNAPLTLSGTDAFKQRCVDIARRERLPIRFDDKTLDEQRATDRTLERIPVPVTFKDREWARQLRFAYDKEAKAWYAPAASDKVTVENWLRERTSEKTEVFVPFKDGRKAFALGFQYNKEEKKWYAPAGTNIEQLRQWQEARLDRSIPLHVPFAESKDAFETGLSYNKAEKTWCAPAGMEKETLRRWQQGRLAERILVHVGFKESKAAFKEGFQYNKEEKQWYAPPGMTEETVQNWQRTHTAGRIEIQVPYADQKEAFGLGLSFDKTDKKWYAPAGTTVETLEQWRQGRLIEPVKIDVPYQNQKLAFKAGFRFDKEANAWCAPAGMKAEALEQWRKELTTERHAAAVPFTEAKEAKKIGLRFDKDEKAWYAPEGTHGEVLRQWQEGRTTEATAMDIDRERSREAREAGMAFNREEKRWEFPAGTKTEVIEAWEREHGPRAAEAEAIRETGIADDWQPDFIDDAPDIEEAPEHFRSGQPEIFGENEYNPDIDEGWEPDFIDEWIEPENTEERPVPEHIREWEEPDIPEDWHERDHDGDERDAARHEERERKREDSKDREQHDEGREKEKQREQERQEQKKQKGIER